MSGRSSGPFITLVAGSLTNDPIITALFGVWWERKVAGRIQLRYGPQQAGPAGLLQTLADGGVRFGRSLGREGTMLYRPRRPSHIALGARRVALVGEAAGFVSPSSAEGVSSALRSASALAAALAPGLDGWAARYRAGTAALRRSVLLKNLKVPILYVPSLRRAILASGIGAVEVGEPPALAPGEGAAAPLR